MWSSMPARRHLTRPLSGRGQTRAPTAFLLTAAHQQPQGGDGLRIERAGAGPGGWMWQVSGRGTISVSGQTLHLETGADVDSPAPRILAFGPRLAGFVAAGGTPVFLGSPALLGAEGDARPTDLLHRATIRRVTRQLGSRVVEWRESGIVLARIRLTELPATVRLRLVEVAVGHLALEAQGVPAGWHMALMAGGSEARGIVGNALLRLDLHTETMPGLVSLRLSDPLTGESLDLVAVWPSRAAMIINPDGQRLSRNLAVSRDQLAGWRGVLPAQGGYVQMRLARTGAPISFRTSGTIRLLAFSDLIDHLLALGGADDRVNLRLIGGGQESPRLEIGRYDWNSKDAPSVASGARLRLSAVNLDAPDRVMHHDGPHDIAMQDWLGAGPGLWLVQGASETLGVMRPFAWSAAALIPSTRERRLSDYADIWRTMLEDPGDPRWETVWQLIRALRNDGNASALDQVQALERAPAAAVALLLRVSRADRDGVLALETEAPIWWPLISGDAWVQGARSAKESLTLRITDAGLPLQLVHEALRRAAGEIVTQRPELRAHLGFALASVQVAPAAILRDGTQEALAVGAPRQKRFALAQEAAKRLPGLPQGGGRLRPVALKVAFGLSDEVTPLLEAPLVAAEVIAGIHGSLSVADRLTLIALRAADTVWFDGALPAALSLALEN